MLKYLIPLVVFAALVAVLAFGLSRDPRHVPSPLVGKPVPAFTLAKVNQPERNLTKADLIGQVSLLNVWASWCVSCRHEHPLLVRLARAKVVPIYGLNYKDERDDAVAWLQQLGDPYTASGSDLDGQVGLDLGVYGVPETFIIDRHGNIAHKHVGPITEAKWKAELWPKIQALRQGAT